MSLKNFITVVVVASMLSCPLIAQSNWSYPMKPGDVHVYTIHPVRPGTNKWKLSVQALYPSQMRFGNYDGNNDTVCVGWNEQTRQEYYTVNNRGMLTQMTGHAAYSSQELYPVQPPTSDSFFLIHSYLNVRDTTYHRVTRRFDTTIFNRNVEAFTIDDRQTISDHFGLVWEYRSASYQNDTLRLSSAVIDGISYNHDSRTWRWMPLCEGNEYFWSIQVKFINPSRLTEERIVKDTTIENRSFAVLRNFTDGGQRFFREEGNDVIEYYDSKMRTIVPANAVPGTITNAVFVVDTTSRLVNGIARRQVTTHTFLPYLLEQVWLENVGCIAEKYLGVTMTDMAKYFSGKSLIYAKVCNEEYGTKDEVEKMREVSFELYQNYPNPVSRTSPYPTIQFYLKSLEMKHATLILFDALGRNIATLFDGEAVPGSMSIDLNTSKLLDNLSSGLYIYRLTIDGKAQTRKMLVMP